MTRRPLTAREAMAAPPGSPESAMLDRAIAPMAAAFDRFRSRMADRARLVAAALAARRAEQQRRQQPKPEPKPAKATSRGRAPRRRTTARKPNGPRKTGDPPGEPAPARAGIRTNHPLIVAGETRTNRHGDAGADGSRMPRGPRS